MRPVGGRVLCRELRGDAVHVGAGVGQTDLGLRPCINKELVTGAARSLRQALERYRRPNLNRIVGERERIRQHPDDLVRDAVQQDLAADDGSIGSEAIAPQLV